MPHMWHSITQSSQQAGEGIGGRNYSEIPTTYKEKKVYLKEKIHTFFQHYVHYVMSDFRLHCPKRATCSHSMCVHIHQRKVQLFVCNTCNPSYRIQWTFLQLHQQLCFTQLSLSATQRWTSWKDFVCAHHSIKSDFLFLGSVKEGRWRIKHPGMPLH